MHRLEFLKKCIETVEEREKEYGPPFEDFAEVARWWKLTLKKDFTPLEVGLLLLDFKRARLRVVKGRKKILDTLEDMVGYISTIAEIMTRKDKE